jgi:hypothetical protein
MRRAFLVVVLFVALVSVDTWLRAPAQTPGKPVGGAFGLSRISTADGTAADIDSFLSSETCGFCHEREAKELQGSMHSASHGEPLYRSFAELARKEAGDGVYTYCSGCHSPAAVVSGLIPKKQDAALPAEAKSGVTCDVCHQITRLTGPEGPWREPGNASFALQPGRVKYASSGTFEKNRAHSGEQRPFYAKAEFCASCHTVIHPENGLRIENTYAEWKGSVYAEKGIQCQDCHMRSVYEALTVAETLKPLVIKGQRVTNGPEREIDRHYFVGGNANADRLAGGKTHAEMADALLKGAARILLKVPTTISGGDKLPLGVSVYNVAAGHNLPTGITELRQMWVELQILDQDGKTLFRSGDLDEKGDLARDAISFGATAVDKAGKETIKPWEMVELKRKHTVPPKGVLRTSIEPKLPPGLSGTITVKARLLYRSASPSVLALVMQEKAFAPKIVEMAKNEATVSVKPASGK